jgi:hypothetical protein
MNDQQFDQIVRMFSRVLSRRSVLVGAGGAFLARSRPAKAASQIETAACGEAGAVCTQIKGCCSGLVCATSYTNPAYGVCVTGEGDMLAVSDDIVVPGAEGVTDELAQLVTGATGTDAETVLAEQEAEIQARKDARRLRNNTQQTNRRGNRSTRQSKRRSNNANQQLKRDGKRAALASDLDAERLNDRPRLLVKLSESLGPNKPEILSVWNRENVPVVVSRVESMKDRSVYDNTVVTIAAGDTYLFFSGAGIDEDKVKSGSTVWAPDEEICTGVVGEGVRLTAAKQFATEKHRFKERCP